MIEKLYKWTLILEWVLWPFVIISFLADEFELFEADMIFMMSAFMMAFFFVLFGNYSFARFKQKKYFSVFKYLHYMSAAIWMMGILFIFLQWEGGEFTFRIGVGSSLFAWVLLAVLYLLGTLKSYNTVFAEIRWDILRWVLLLALSSLLYF